MLLVNCFNEMYTNYADLREIIELGNHDELMAMEGGIYRHRFKMQFKDPYKNEVNSGSLEDLRTVPQPNFSYICESKPPI